MSTVSESSTESVLSARIRVPDHVVYRSFASETVMLNLQTGQYHGINPVGGRMIASLERCATVREAAQELSSEFKISSDRLEQDLCEFCVDLSARGLVEVTQVTTDR
jgi:hypothetical protein